MNNKISKFGERLVEKMIEKKVTQKELADLLNTTQQTVSNWVKGIHEPDLTTFLRLCFYFDEDANYLSGFDELQPYDFYMYDIELEKELTEEEQRYGKSLEERSDEIKDFEDINKFQENYDYFKAIKAKIDKFKNSK